MVGVTAQEKLSRKKRGLFPNIGTRRKNVAGKSKKVNDEMSRKIFRMKLELSPVELCNE